MRWKKFILINYKRTIIFYIFGLLLINIILFTQTESTMWGFLPSFLELTFLMFLFMSFVSQIIFYFNKLNSVKKIQDFAQEFSNDRLKNINLMITSHEHKTSFVLTRLFPFSKQDYLFISQTLINTLSHSELEGVIAHELGHIYHRHSVLRFIFISILPVVFFMQLSLFLSLFWLLKISMGIIILLLAFLMILTSAYLSVVFLNILLQGQEVEADNFARYKAMIRGDVMQSALSKLSQDNKSFQLIKSHPSNEIRFLLWN